MNNQEPKKFSEQTKLTSIFAVKKTKSLEITSNDKVDLNNALSTELIDFVSVTWIGNFAEHSPKDIPPIKLAQQIVSRNITVLLHITCRNLDKESALNILNHIKSIGVRNILALEGESRFVTEKDRTKVDFPYTYKFVEFVKQNFADYFSIGVTGYPQKHPRSTDMKQEMEFLQLKVSKGADFIVTQGCLQKSIISDFLTLCKNFSIDLPIVVGTFIVSSHHHLDTMKRCNINVDDEFSRFFGNPMNEGKGLKNYYIARLRDIGEMIFGSGVGEFAGLHIFSTINPEDMLDIMDEFSYFARHFQHINIGTDES